MMAVARTGVRVEYIEGWGAIAARVSSRSGLEVSTDAAKRWARRDEDPLPVQRWGGLRPRVAADALALDEWTDRQWSLMARE